MTTSFALVIGLVLGALCAWLVFRSRYAAGLAAAESERDLFRERAAALEAAAGENHEAAVLLAPLRETLNRVERQVGVLERDRADQFGSIRTLLARVETETGQVGRATAALAGSLRAANVRGAWGEVQLRRVLESSGMLPHCDFEEQVPAHSATGALVRPDVVVRIPGGKSIVVDAKAPMLAFLDAQSERIGDAARDTLLASHAQSLSEHVGILAGKEYWSAFPATPELVVCFVPSEAMLASALSHDPTLHERAMAQRVVIVGPGSLLALLKAVAVAWREDALTASARELLDLGRELHHRLGTLGTHTAKLGRSLRASVEAYNALVGALESRVLVTARRMSDLGLVSGTLDEIRPLDVASRPLTAAELLDAATADDARPDLHLDEALRLSDASRTRGSAVG